MMKLLRLYSCLLILFCLFSLPASAFRDIEEVVVFSDSMSDSNGDDYFDSKTALSTYNLLRTLRGDKVEVDHHMRRPLDLGDLLSTRMTTDSLKAGLQRFRREMESEREEMTSCLAKLKNHLQEFGVGALTTLVIETLSFFDDIQHIASPAILGPLEKLSRHLAEKAGETQDKEHQQELKALNQKIKLMMHLAKTDFSHNLLEAGEEALVAISSKFGEMIPDIPSKAYEVGKWTAGREYDLLWPQALVKMMTIPGKNPAEHPVMLRNMSMAGSWVLSTSNKLDEFDDLLETADGFEETVTMLFQGSLIPPCLEQIVNSFLSQQRIAFNSTHDRFPKEKEHYLSKKQGFVVFHGCNDFLNNWNDPHQVARELAYEVEDLMVAGAWTIIVVLLPDISVTPRYLATTMREEGQSIKEKIQIFNASLSKRISDLRTEYDYESSGLDESKPCLIAIDAQPIFEQLREEEDIDPLHPLLKVAIPGMDKATAGDAGKAQAEQERIDAIRKRELDEAKEQGNWVKARLLQNKAYADYWIIEGAESDDVEPGKVALFADTVHLSAEGHDRLARKMCKMAREKHGFSCDSDNYPPFQAMADCTARRTEAIAQ
ncbi:hypothetical protein ACWJJH_06125 [Endozoicomonadaceae bacterium StTr2]